MTWNYKQAQAASDFPRVAVKIRKVAPEWVIAIEIHAVAGAAPAFEKLIPWYTEAELLRVGWPSPAQWPMEIEARVQEHLIGRHRDDVFGALQAVPLVRDARLVGSARAVLPLDWNRHRALAFSEFKLLYQTPVGVAIVSGNGLGDSFAYPQPPPSSGLVLQLHKFELGGTVEPLANRLGELQGLQPFVGYLTRFNPLGAISPDTPGAGVPSVAPPR